MEAGRGAEVARIKTAIEDTLQNRQTAAGHRILSYESDPEILFEATRPWKISLQSPHAKQGHSADPWRYGTPATRCGREGTATPHSRGAELTRPCRLKTKGLEPKLRIPKIGG